jgi:NAD(P)-dependent dehydrogenase (short-subunit alcohol dehydrogenase family)
MQARGVQNLGKIESMQSRLRDKVAVITGGASGIGREIAKRYVEEEARVVLGDRDGSLLQGVKSELGHVCAVAKIDVTIEADVEGLVRLAVSHFGSLDIWVNCAGVGGFAPLIELTETQWNTVLDVCLKGVFLSLKHVARQMMAGGKGGVIINVSSINARQPAEGLSAYCTAKAGVEMLTRCAAMELGSKGIRVVGIGPGIVDTPLTQYQRDHPEVRQAFLANIPMGRIGTPRDVANAALFLASDEAAWVSGDTLFVDGAELTKMYPELITRFGRRS